MNKKIFLSLSIFFIVTILFFFHFHGFIAYDDGWFLQDGLRLLHGEKIYKDFQYLYNPGSLYLNALAFKIFGESIAASRIVALANSLISIVCLLLIFYLLRVPTIIGIITILCYTFWGPGHINFVWPVMFCIANALATSVLFLPQIKEKQYSLFFLAGATAAWTFILKQNFGLAIFIGNAIFFILTKKYREKFSMISYSSGYILVIFLQVLYLLSTNTLGNYIQSFYYFNYIKIFQHGILNSSLPWEFPEPLLFKILKILFYTFPFFLSIISIVLLKQKNKLQLTYLPIQCGLYYILSIRPTTDYIHLAPLLALSLVILAILFVYQQETLVKYFIVVLLCSFCLLGIYSALFRNYYRWDTPLTQQQMFMNNPRILIWTDNKSKTTTEQVSSFYEKHAKDEKYTFIYSFSPIYYFVTNKKNPTPFDDLQLGGLAKKDQQFVISVLKNKHVKHILTDTDITHDHSLIASFTRENYIPVKKINDITIWEGRVTPKYY